MRFIYPMCQKTQSSKQKLDMALRSIDELHDIEHSPCDVLTFVIKSSFDSSLQITSVPLSIASRSCRLDAARRLQASDRKTGLSGCEYLAIIRVSIVHSAGPQIQIRCQTAAALERGMSSSRSTCSCLPSTIRGWPPRTWTR
jgi:hypothetical protein